MMLEEYRIRTVESLKVCLNIVSARDLLSQVNLVLISTRISHQAQTVFWDQLTHDLELLAQESTLLGGKIAAEHSAVLAAAQELIAQYQRLIATGQHR